MALVMDKLPNFCPLVFHLTFFCTFVVFSSHMISCGVAGSQKVQNGRKCRKKFFTMYTTFLLKCIIHVENENASLDARTKWKSRENLIFSYLILIFGFKDNFLI